MVNSLRECYGSDVAVAPAYSFTETVIKADYSEKLVAGMIMPNALQAFSCEMTGEQLREYLKYSVEGVEGGFTPFNRGSLPAVSGISIEIEQDGDGFVLKKVIKDGKELKDSEKLSVVCLNTQQYMDPLIEAAGFEFTVDDMRVTDRWPAYIIGGGKIAAPENYITLR